MQSHLNITAAATDEEPPVRYVEFSGAAGLPAAAAIDVSGIVYENEPTIAFGTVRFPDGADREVVVKLLREVADFFEQNQFANRA